MANSPKTLPQNILALISAMTALKPSGDTGISGQLYFMNPNQTADTGDGQSVDTAKQWTNSAVVLCTDGVGDLIVRLPGNENIDDDDGDPPIVINKSATVILGVGGGNPDQQGEVNGSTRRRQNAGWGAAAGPAIDAQVPCTIYGIEVIASAQNAILISGNGGGENGAFILIEKCRFPSWGLMTEAIHFDAGAYNKIKDCRFENLTGAGIMFDSTVANNPDYNEVEGCIFQGCVFGIDTDAGATPHNMLIRGNIFVSSNTQAMTNAIRTLGAWDSGEISGNHFGCTRAQAYDVGVAALRAAGVRVFGNTYTDGTDEDLDRADTEVPVTVNANLGAPTDIINLPAVATNQYTVKKLRLKSADPGVGNDVIVRLWELVNGVLTQVDDFTITTGGANPFIGYYSLMDMFGIPDLVGDQLQVTVQQEVAGGPTAITAEYTYTTM